MHLAERVRHGIEKGQVVFDGARLAVTVSIGVAVWPRDGATGPELVAAADRALYAAKQAGRNRVMVAAAVPPAPRTRGECRRERERGEQVGA